jgi:hypothetical protein
MSQVQSFTDGELGGLLEFWHCWQPPDVEAYSFAGQTALTHDASLDAPRGLALPDGQLMGR